MDMELVKEIENDLELDLLKLDEGWLSLPTLTYKWNAMSVEAEMDARNSKTELEQLRATLDARMRENPMDYGISKVTEASLTNAITIHPEVVKSTALFNQKDKLNKILKASGLALEAKRKALEGLTSLYQSSYFANKPIYNSPASDIVQDRETQNLNTESNKKVMKRIKK